MSIYKELLNDFEYIPYFDNFNSLEIKEAVLLFYLIYYDDLENYNGNWMEINPNIIREKRPSWKEKTIRSSLKKLVDKGYIFKQDGNGRGNLYKLNLKKIKAGDSFIIEESEINNISKRKNITYSRSDENLSDEDFYNKFKGSKNPKVLMSWTRRVVSDKKCADALVSWISLMNSNGKWQTLSLYNDKIAFIYDNKGDLNPVDIVNDTIEKGYFSFSYSIDYLNRKNKAVKWNDKIKMREYNGDTSKIKMRG